MSVVSHVSKIGQELKIFLCAAAIKQRFFTNAFQSEDLPTLCSVSIDRHRFCKKADSKILKKIPRVVYVDLRRPQYVFSI